jgi:hypothetical protein
MAAKNWFARVRSIDVRIIASAGAAVLLIGGVMWTIPTTPDSNSFKFDAPRRDFSSARPVEPGKPIQGQIVDGSDIDYYRIRSSDKGGRVQIHVQNDSATFIPGLSVYDNGKKLIEERSASDYGLETQPNSTYYIQVWGQRSTTGPYTLTVTQ